MTNAGIFNLIINDNKLKHIIPNRAFEVSSLDFQGDDLYKYKLKPKFSDAFEIDYVEIESEELGMLEDQKLSDLIDKITIDNGINGSVVFKWTGWVLDCLNYIDNSKKPTKVGNNKILFKFPWSYFTNKEIFNCSSSFVNLRFNIYLKKPLKIKLILREHYFDIEEREKLIKNTPQQFINEYNSKSYILNPMSDTHNLNLTFGGMASHILINFNYPVNELLNNNFMKEINLVCNGIDIFKFDPSLLMIYGQISNNYIIIPFSKYPLDGTKEIEQSYIGSFNLSGISDFNLKIRCSNIKNIDIAFRTINVLLFDNGTLVKRISNEPDEDNKKSPKKEYKDEYKSCDKFDKDYCEDEYNEYYEDEDFYEDYPESISI